MPLSQEDRLYREFEKKHKKAIEERLRAKFLPIAESADKNVTHDTDFAAMVGIPLFVIAVAWMCSSYRISDWIIGLILLGVGFIIRYHQRNVIYCTCRRMFWETQCSIIGDYIDAQMYEEMSKQPEDMRDEVHRLYSYYYKQMIFESFDYTKRG